MNVQLKECAVERISKAYLVHTMMSKLKIMHKGLTVHIIRKIGN